MTTETQFPSVALTVGSFDGVHLGHRRILDAVVAAARAANGTAAVMTLKPHPREFFSPEHAPCVLTSFSKKMALFEEAGIDVVYVLDFDAGVANLERGEFLETIIRGRCRAKAIVVGHDFRFGKGATGDHDYLAKAGPRLGFAVSQVPPLFVDGERVSSTVVRERILEGDLTGAERFLGRKYSIMGEVIAGRGVGRSLGFPTANIHPGQHATPAQGVYAAEVVIEGQRCPAAVNVGIAPTVRHADIMIEAHLLGCQYDVCHKTIEIVFHKRLRPERKFPTRQALQRAIQTDVEAVKDYFAALG